MTRFAGSWEVGLVVYLPIAWKGCITIFEGGLSVPRVGCLCNYVFPLLGLGILTGENKQRVSVHSQPGGLNSERLDHEVRQRVSKTQSEMVEGFIPVGWVC